MSDIIVSFKPDGHKDLVIAIKAIQSAQKNLTVAGKKHNVVVADMTAKLKAQNLSWKKLGVSMKTAGEAAKGNRVAMAKLNLAMKQNIRSGNGMLKSNRLIGSSFATMRSHLLLFQFAMAMGIRQIVSFSKTAAKIQDMERGFNTLSGGSINAAVAITKLQKATNETMSEFDLFQQANNAMILGVTRNSNEMAKMFDMAQRLGNALGRDTKDSVESLITGIGRQSRLMLDNIGIIVKADQAYKDYAREIGKTAGTLTDFEKKQAFTNAALEAAEEKLKLLPQETLTSNQAFQQFSASMDNLQKNIGEAFLPMIKTLASVMKDFADAMDPQRVKAYATLVGVVLVGAMIAYQKQLEKVIMRQTALGWGALATAIGILSIELLNLKNIFNDYDDGIDKVEESTDSFLKKLKGKELKELEALLAAATDKYDNLNASVENSSESQEGMNKILTKSFLVGDKFNEINEKGAGAQAYLDGKVDLVNKSLDKQNHIKSEATKKSNEHINASEEEIRLAKENQEQIQNMIDTIEGSFSTYESFLQSREEVLDMYNKTRDAQVADIDTNIATTQSLLDIAIAAGAAAEAQKEYTDVLQMLQLKKASILQAEEQAQFGVWSRMAKGAATVADAFGAGAKEVALLQAAGATVDAFAGASSARFNAQKAGMLPPIPGIAYAIELAAGLANAKAVYDAATKVSSSGGGSTPRFAEGGYVGGRPHSQGGTIIEAERGEFVMSRNATESIGLETLNQMNQSGGGGSINVSVTGNVLTQDFVEGELAESIKEAVRRGSDFGLS
jgi:hypothetical protein